ncbi:tumor protein p53-inducible nuclear protein 1 [Neosynchiropus ocellatus]
MFQRFASALFGDGVEELKPNGCQGDGEAEVDDEDWILVNYLDADSGGEAGAVSPDDEELVQIPSPMATPVMRYASCTSLNSTTDTDPDGGGEEAGDEEGAGFLCLDMASMEESWFVTPPPCFTGFSGHVGLESSPLENLLIEHPSMSVYVRHRGPRLHLLPGGATDTPPVSSRKKGRRLQDGPKPRPDVAAAKQRSSSRHLAATLSGRAELLHQRQDLTSVAAQPSTRNALRRLNLLRPQKTNNVLLHQPNQRHLNY